MSALKAKIIILIVLVIIAGLFFWTGKSAVTGFDRSISDGTVTIEYPSREFGLAVNKEQLLVTSYIPPCDEGFNYCFYYIGKVYEGTNFESAGIAVKKRSDLSMERLCLDTPPEGFSSAIQPDKTNSADTHSFALYGNVGGAGAGHMANGGLYRLFIKAPAACYEFTTRIGQTQFLNYPEGTIKEFTREDGQAMRKKLEQVVENISYSGLKKLFSN